MSFSNRSAQVTSRERVILLGVPLLVGMVTPGATRIAVQTIVGGVPFGAAVVDVARKELAETRNLFSPTLFGLIPFVVLTIRLSQCARAQTCRTCYALCLCGLIGILALMVPAHVDVWSAVYGPGPVCSRIGVAFVVIPVYCTGTLFLGLFIGHHVTKAPLFQRFPIGHCQGCGYNLRGNASGVCPECGIRVLP